MRDDRGYLYLLLASSLTFLASLYMTWVVGISTASSSPNQLFSLFSEAFSSSGWSFWGQAGALAALALAAGAVALLLRPQLSTRLPLGSCTLALMFFAVANLLELRGDGIFESAVNRVSIHVGHGAYVGVASAAVACLAVVGVRWDEVGRRPSAIAFACATLTLGVLAALVLPWLHVRVLHLSTAGGAVGYQDTNFEGVEGVFVVAIACLGIQLWGRGAPPGRRLGTASALVVLTAGAFSPFGTHTHWPYEAWLQLGCSVALVALALTTGRGLRIGRPAVADAAMVLALSLLLASLFLPWQRNCAQEACFSQNGWSQTYSSTAGGLAAILVAFVGFRRPQLGIPLASAVFVGAAGSEITLYAHLGYGAPLGFAGAALLLLLTAPRPLRDMRRDLKRLLTRLPPMLACLGFLAAPVVALTGRVAFDSSWHVWLLGVAAIVLSLHLLGRWLTGPRSDDELVLLPLVLLALTGLDLGYVYRQGITWEGWLSAGLCLVLVVLGWIEARGGGLESLSEMFRVDRIPEPGN